MAKITPSLTIGSNSIGFVIQFVQNSASPNMTGATVNVLIQPLTSAGAPTGTKVRYACTFNGQTPQYTTTGSDVFASAGLYECQLEYLNTGQYYTSNPAGSVYIQVLANLLAPA